MDDLALLRDVFAGRRGLPGPYFTAREPFDREMTLLRSEWLCVGLAADVAKPGDVLPLTAGGYPLVMLRDHRGELRVFHNVCSHRGATLVEARAKGCSRLVCPYHCWSYDLDGTLVRTPHVGGYRIHTTPEADVSQLGLREVACGEWFGLVFVNLSGTAMAFEDFVAPLNALYDYYDPSILREEVGAGQSITVGANWKSIIENFVESYHVPLVHPELEAYNPMWAHYQILGGAHYVGQGGNAWGADGNDREAPGGDLPRQPGFAKKPFSYEAVYIYPNLILVPFPQFCQVLILTPEAPDRSVERLAVWFHTDEAMRAEQAANRKAIVDSIVRVNDEDIEIVERVQRGRVSPAFEGGVFVTAQEASSLLVQRQIAGRLLQMAGEAADLATLPMHNVHHHMTPASLAAQ